MSKAVNKVYKAPTKQARPTEDLQCDPPSAGIPNQVLFFFANQRSTDFSPIGPIFSKVLTQSVF